MDRIVAKSSGAARLDLELFTLPSLLTYYSGGVWRERDN